MTKINVFAITVAIAMVTAVVVLTSVGQLTHIQCGSLLTYIIGASIAMSPFVIMDIKDTRAKKRNNPIKNNK